MSDDLVMADRFADMFTDPDDDPRDEGPFLGDERPMLVGFLHWQRSTLAMKCDGLDPEQLARRSLAPSALSLLGLIRHLTDVERGWFRMMMAGENAQPLFSSTADPDADFNGATADPDLIASAWQLWGSEAEFTDHFITTAASLNITGDDPWRGPMSLRWVLVHVIEEYARHNGHADLLREKIDGAVGQ